MPSPHTLKYVITSFMPLLLSVSEFSTIYIQPVLLCALAEPSLYLDTVSTPIRAFVSMLSQKHAPSPHNKDSIYQSEASENLTLSFSHLINGGKKTTTITNNKQTETTNSRINFVSHNKFTLLCWHRSKLQHIF